MTAGVDLPMAAWLPITRGSVMCVMLVSLSARITELVAVVVVSLTKSGDRHRAEVTLMANRRAAAPAAAHGVPRRLLVFKLADQLALCFADGASDVRVLSNRY